MAYTREQWKSMGTRLYQEGDTEGAKYAMSQMDALDAPQETARPKYTTMSHEDQELFDLNPDGTPRLSEAEQLAVSIGRGFTDIGRGAQDLYARATGDDDALARITKRNEEEAVLMKPLEKESPWIAGGGRLIGQMAATAPIGLVGRGAALAARGGKAAFAAGAPALTNNARFGVGLAEGATAGFVGTQGDMETRVKAGLIEGATGGLLESGMGSVVDGFVNRSALKKGAKEGIAETERTVADEIARTQREGGYTKSYGDVMEDQASIDIRDTTRAIAGDETVAKFERQQELDIQAKAREMAVDSDGGIQRTPNELGDGIQGTLAAERKAAEKLVDDKYDAWRATHGGNTKVDTDGLREVVNAELGKVMQGQKSLKPEVAEIMERYGITLNTKGTDVMSDRIGSLDGPLMGTSPRGQKSKPLSVDDAELIIQELNSLYSPANKPMNAAAGRIKTAVDDFVQDGFDAGDLGPNSPIRAGREAREAKREMHKEWDGKSLAAKLTELTKGGEGEDYVKTALYGVEQLKKKGNIKDLRKVKLKMNSTPEGRAAWNDIQATELFEALEAGVPSRHAPALMAGEGVENMNSSGYSRRWDKLDIEAQNEIFGKEKAEQVRGAIKTWGERGRQSGTRGNPTKQGSGRSRAVGQALIRLTASGGRMGTKILAGIPVLTQIVDHFSNKSLVKAFNQNAIGKMSKSQKKEYASELKDAFYDTYSGTVAKQYGQQFNVMLTEMFADNNEKNEEGQ
jgi:hypothetical protein